MNVAIIGNNDGPERIAAALRQSEHEVVFVAQQRGARPRVQRIVADEQSLADALQGLDVDLIVNCFANFRYRFLHHAYPILNVHLAPLPRYRGRHPLQWALINGEPTFGVTVHRINDDWDDGPIHWQGTVRVGDGWSVNQLREALLTQVEANIGRIVTDFPTAQPLPNEANEATYVKRRTRTDSRIEDWRDSELTFRTVNALRDGDYPAYAFSGGQEIAFRGARRGEPAPPPAKPGAILAATDGEIRMAFADGQTLWLATPQTHLLQTPLPSTNYDYRPNGPSGPVRHPPARHRRGGGRRTGLYPIHRWAARPKLRTGFCRVRWLPQRDRLWQWNGRHRATVGCLGDRAGG